MEKFRAFSLKGGGGAGLHTIKLFFYQKALISIVYFPSGKVKKSAIREAVKNVLADFVPPLPP